MMNIDSQLRNEMRRIENGPSSTEKPGGVGSVRFLVRCPFGTHDVLEKAKSVLRILDEAGLRGWPANEEYIPQLPEWFTFACISEMSNDQAQKWLEWWRSLPPDEQTRAEIEKDWSLENWLYWMEPENRQWFWWDAVVLENHDHIALAVEVEFWPFPWGALRWLFRAAGASAVEAEE